MKHTITIITALALTACAPTISPECADGTKWPGCHNPGPEAADNTAAPRGERGPEPEPPGSSPDPDGDGVPGIVSGGDLI